MPTFQHSVCRALAAARHGSGEMGEGIEAVRMPARGKTRRLSTSQACAARHSASILTYCSHAQPGYPRAYVLITAAQHFTNDPPIELCRAVGKCRLPICFCTSASCVHDKHFYCCRPCASDVRDASHDDIKI